MWAVEKDPALRSDFCNLTILDRRPSDSRLRATAARAVAAIPRLGQRVVSAPLRLVPPEFADDPTLDLDAHMRVVAVPAPGDQDALLTLCAELASQPLDRARPLWEFTLIEGLPDGRAALLQKVHHTITDGVGGLRLSLALVDLERNPSEPPVIAPRAPIAGATTSPFAVTCEAIVEATQRGVGAVMHSAGSAGHLVVHPLEVPGAAARAVRVVGSLQRQALVTRGACSDVLDGRSLRRVFTVHQLPLELLRDVAAAFGGSVNDAFVTGLAAALGHYHRRTGSEVRELRLAMPVSTRGHDDAGGNRFVPTRVVVPIEPADDLPALFAAVHARLDQTKHEEALATVENMAGLVSMLPTALLVALTRSQTRTIDFAASNLRGSPVPLYLAGARILANYPFGPRTGTALNVTMMSYCDEVHMGCNLDPAAITDPGAFMRDVGDAFQSLADVVSY